MDKVKKIEKCCEKYGASFKVFMVLSWTIGWVIPGASVVYLVGCVVINVVKKA